jgi:phosphate-selective porin OprO/OprP
LQTVRAEETAPPSQTIEERLEALDQRQRVLERNRELDKETAQEKSKAAAVAGAGKDGFALKSADGDFQLKVGGFVHADGRFYLDDEQKPATNTFLIRRAFLNFEGTVYRNFVFRIQPDFGGGKTTLQDAYLDARFNPAFQLLVGKTKVPFLLERIQSATDRRFVELAFPNSLSPNRDIGVFLHGDLLKGAVTYALGIFNGLPDGDTSDVDTNNDKDSVARLFVHPFQHTEIEPLRGLGLGVAATYGNQEGKVDTSKKSFTSNLPSYKTSGQQTFFSYIDKTGEPTKDFSSDNNVIADGSRTRISPQAYYYRGPFGLLGEYVQTRQEVRKKNDVEKLTNSAWQAAAYYVVTGEKNSFKHISPSKPFDLGKGQWGAVELVARYSELRVDGDAFPRFADPTKSANRAKAWAAGLNWYLNPKVKVAANYEQTRFKGGASGNVDREAEKVILSRFEVAY